METQLSDKFNDFQIEVGKLQSKPQDLERQLSANQGKLARLKVARSSQLALDETEKAKTLAKQIESLQEEIEILQAKIAAYGPGGQRSAQYLVANAGGSELFDLALSIVEKSADIAPDLETELQYFVSWGAEGEKQKYLDKIEDLSNKLAKLGATCRAGLYCQQFLPDELRQCRKPRLIAPLQSKFQIDVTQVGEVYKPLSKVYLPD